MREAEEEVGLNPDSAEILGRMDDFITGTGFHISPVVALVPRGVVPVSYTHLVENLVEPGEIDPDHIITPGIFVKRIINLGHVEKRIEQRTVRKRAA